MTRLFSRILRLVLTLVLAAFGLVFMVSLMAAALIVVVLSLLKGLITGKKPAVSMTFNRFQKYSPKGMWPAASNPNMAGKAAGNVVDVEVREVKEVTENLGQQATGDKRLP